MNCLSKINNNDSQKKFLIIGGIFIASMFLLLLLFGIFNNPEESTPEPTDKAPVIGIG